MSDNTGMNYDASPIPGGKPGSPPTEVVPDRQIQTDANGNLHYDSAAASGMVQVFLPGLPGDSHGEERLLAKDFGPFVAGKIQSSFERQPYIQSGPQQRPSQVFRHYIASVKGASLADSGAIGRMESLAKEFENEVDQREYFDQVLRPYLHSLAPKRRT